MTKEEIREEIDDILYDISIERELIHEQNEKIYSCHSQLCDHVEEIEKHEERVKKLINKIGDEEND